MSRYRSQFVIAVLFSIVATPAFAVFPDFKASNFYAMLGLKPTARRVEIESALNRADHETRSDRNEFSNHDHAFVLRLARDILMNESGRREVYDSFLQQGVDGLNVYDHASYMEATELAFKDLKERYGVTAAEERMNVFRRYIVQHPIADVESHPIYQVKSPWLSAQSCSKALFWLGVSGGVTAIAGLGGKMAWNYFSSPATPPAPPSTPTPAVVPDISNGTNPPVPGRPDGTSPSDPPGVFVGNTPTGTKNDSKAPAPIAAAPKEKAPAPKTVPVLSPSRPVRNGNPLIGPGR